MALWSRIDSSELRFHGLFMDSPLDQYFAHEVLWWTAQWAARTTRRRRPGRSLTVGLKLPSSADFGLLDS